MMNNHPRIVIELDEHPESFDPGKTISGRYRLDVSDSTPPVGALEWSILWSTEGAGDEDQGVHALGRVEPQGLEGVTRPDHWREFEAILPESPQSYDGLLIKIAWRVRVRALVGKDPEWLAEVPFRLGNVDRAREVESKKERL
jgi:hypothetical protein